MNFERKFSLNAYYYVCNIVAIACLVLLNLANMKKIHILLLSFMVVVLLSACVNNQNKNIEDFAFRRPDFGQPERQPDISGIVKSIVGNEVKIIKLERPARDQNIINDSNNQDSIRLGFGSGMGEGRGSFGRDRSTQDRTEMLARMKEMSTGEEKIIIPVGIQMLKFSQFDADGNPEIIEATLTDIIPDKMIKIWLDENISDKKIASFVLIAR